MSSKPQFTTRVQNPPGKEIIWPTSPSNLANPPVFKDAMHIRTVVFVDEQHCSLENELDEDDHRSWQWVVYATNDQDGSSEDKATPVGVIRLVPPPHAPHPNHSAGANGGGGQDNHQEADKSYVKLTRIAILPEFRRHGLGRVLVNAALEWAGGHAREIGHGWKGLVLVHAQVAVEKVWGRMGFVPDPSLGQWDEEGIMHLGMWRRVESDF